MLRSASRLLSIVFASSLAACGGGDDTPAPAPSIALKQALAETGGTVAFTGCSFSGNVGTLQATHTVPGQAAVPFTAPYTFQ